MNGSKFIVEGSRWYEQLKAMNDMNDTGSWAKGSKCYENFGL